MVLRLGVCLLFTLLVCIFSGFLPLLVFPSYSLLFFDAGVNEIFPDHGLVSRLPSSFLLCPLPVFVFWLLSYCCSFVLINFLLATIMVGSKFPFNSLNYVFWIFFVYFRSLSLMYCLASSWDWSFSVRLYLLASCFLLIETSYSFPRHGHFISLLRSFLYLSRLSPNFMVPYLSLNLTVAYIIRCIS